MSVFGDMLLYFPEQRRTITIYEMKPKINGGFETIDGSAQTVSGIWQHTSPKAIKDGNGNLVKSAGLEWWTEYGNLDGKYTALEGDVFILHSIQSWKYEGGFYRYNLEKVVGNDGTESINTSWNFGSNSFS